MLAYAECAEKSNIVPMKIIIRISFVCLLFLVFAAIGLEDLLAQCPMCKAAAESNLKEGGKAGAGLNAGILYLFFTPYILVVSVGAAWWWRNVRNKA